MGWLRRLRNTIGSETNRDFDDEARFHLEERTTEYIQRGMTAEDARREALRRFGNVTLMMERTRDADTVRWLHDIRQDLSYTLRLLRRSPGFTAAAVLSLALGIGANTSIFTIVDALQFTKLSVEDPERLAMLRFETGQRSQYNIPYESFERLASGMAPVADAAATFLVERYNVVVDGAEDRTDPAEVCIGLVSGNYFALLGVHALRGRAFTPEENRLGDPREVAVISHGYWKHRFGLSPDVIGRTLKVQNTTYTIVGVTPPEFRGDWIGRPADMWVPFAVAPRITQDGTLRFTAGAGVFGSVFSLIRPIPGKTVMLVRPNMLVNVTPEPDTATA